MLNFYFKWSIFCDYTIGLLIACFGYFLLSSHFLILPTEERLLSTASDMSTIALTMAGFILTLSTVLISFKSTVKVDRNNIQDTDKAFDIFFVSKLYLQTIQILTNAIKSLSAIALLGYIFKLTISNSFLIPLYLYCVFGIVVITLTILRCVFILTAIVKIQQEE